MARAVAVMILLMVGLSTPARAEFTVAAACRWALLAPVRVMKTVLGSASSPRVVLVPDSNRTREATVHAALGAAYPGARIERMGMGGMSMVFRVVPMEGPALVASVARHPDDAATIGEYQRASAFVQRARQLPGLADSFPATETRRLALRPAGEVIQVSALAGGGDLAHSLFLFGSKVPEEKMLKLWSEISGPLAKVHQQWGIAHTDIKPHNIFLVALGDGEFRLQIGDWGGYHEPSNLPPQRSGTPAYQTAATLAGRYSPEQDDIRATQLVFLQMALGMNQTQIMNQYPDCVEKVEWKGHPEKVPHLVRIPSELAQKLPTSLRAILETNFASIEALHEAVALALAEHS